MDRHLVPILILLVIGIFGFVNCYKWVPLKSGSPLPNNTVSIESLSEVKYVGRAKHFDDILPAEVDVNGIARISACGEEIIKAEYEILTSLDDCEWLSEIKIKREEIILHVGTSNWNNEPIFVGVNNDGYSSVDHIISIYGNNAGYDRRSWSGSTISNRFSCTVLCCNFKTDWVAATATQLPNNILYSGVGHDGHDTFVARLRKDCDKVIGQVIPHMGIAKALLSNGNTMQTVHVDVLSEPDQYAWRPGSKGTIPDYPIVEEHGYIAIVNKTVISLTRKDALELMSYEILTTNYSKD